MTLRHNTLTPRMERALSKSVSFELTIADLARRSERRAWWVACSAAVLSLILAGGYFYILPLKEKVPYLVMADAYTGTSTVARMAGDFNRTSITASEAINRSNVAHFVLARESYDYTLMRLRDWTTVYTMSAPAVASGYTSLHAPRNPDSPYNTYGKSRAIRVKILSIQLIGGGSNAAPTGATVRFQRSLYDDATGVARPLDSRIATLAFAYKANLSMDEKDRIENPLGFQVTRYRADSDYAPAPPLDDRDSQPAVMTPTGEIAQAQTAAISPQEARNVPQPGRDAAVIPGAPTRTPGAGSGADTP